MRTSDTSRWLASITLVLVVLLGIGPVWPGGDRAQAQDATPPPEAGLLADREVFGFLPYWELAASESIDLETVTTIAWFGLEAGVDGRLIRETADAEPTPGWAGWNDDAFDVLLERSRLAGVRVVLTVERFSWDRAGRRATKALLSDPDARTVLVDDIVEVIATRGAQGVNLDFEPLPTAVRGDFVRLVRELRAALDAVDPSLQLTFDLPPSVTGYPLKRLIGPSAADAVVLMGYEYRTPSSRIAGSVAPLRDREGLDVRDSVERTLARVPAERVILALPWYGRAWSTRGDENGAKTRKSERYIDAATAVYRSAVARAAVAGRRYDRRQASAWSVYRSRADATSPISWRQLWYDDVDSVRSKVRFARRKGLRGIGIWALGYEGGRPELWSALRYAIERPSDDQPPMGQASVAAESIIGELRIGEQDGVPVVGEAIKIDLSAADGSEGSGVAFVRLATNGRLREDGALRTGTTFPAVDAVHISLPDADPVDEVFVPGGGEPAEATISGPTDASWTLETVIVRVQWRDVAGNWSEPLELQAAYRQMRSEVAEPT